MKRLLPLVVAVWLFSGCTGQSPPASDPFFGRTRVAPPATGSIPGGSSNPYYQGGPSVVIPQTPSGTAAPPAVSSGAASVPSGTLAGRERVIRILEPRPMAPGGSPQAADRHSAGAG